VYTAPPPTGLPAKRLVPGGAPSGTEGFVFYERLEIGRFKEGRDATGVLLVDEPTVSSRHCVVTQDERGRCWVRDVSRNGTRLDGRRLSPNLRTEMRVGQILTVAEGANFRLAGEPADVESSGERPISSTVGISNPTLVTVLVGDIRDYTVLVQEAPSGQLQESVGRVFGRLEREVVRMGGTLKEFQGDALFAFWEQSADHNPAQEACAAALELHRLSNEIGRDPEIWSLEDHPLRLDWALATGPVVISGHGSDGALGLSMVGESVVLAFRIEKFADDTTGAIVACPQTREMARKRFKFKDLGTRSAKGFERPQRLYALTGKKLISL
jgi:class 3 adenylate cyclase